MATSTADGSAAFAKIATRKLRVDAIAPGRRRGSSRTGNGPSARGIRRPLLIGNGLRRSARSAHARLRRL